MTEGAPKSLKILVWAMGILLIGGFLFLIGTLAGKTGEAVIEPDRSMAAACQPARLSFAPAQLAQPPAYENGIWAVVIREPRNIRFMEIDACTGEVLSTLSSGVEGEYP